jgi:hypothetical protein
VDYDVSFDLVVNEHIRTNIGLHIIYDDDIKSKKTWMGANYFGAKTQLKQVLGVGLFSF